MEAEKNMKNIPIYKNLDYVTVSSPEVAWAYEEAMCLKKNSGQIQPIGISRTDVFFQSGISGTEPDRRYGM